MTDFRMNKSEPIGSRNLSTIAGFTSARRPKPVPKPIEEKFEVTPDLLEAVENVSIPVALGTMITTTEGVVEDDESRMGEHASSDMLNGDNDEAVGEKPSESNPANVADDDSIESRCDTCVVCGTEEKERDDKSLEEGASVVEEEASCDASCECTVGDELPDSNGEGGECEEEDGARATDAEVKCVEADGGIAVTADGKARSFTLGNDPNDEDKEDATKQSEESE